MKVNNEIILKYYNFINAKQLISKTDIHGNIIDVNDYFSEISQYSKSELIGLNHSIVRHKDSKKSSFINLWKVILSGKIWSGTIKNISKKGNVYWIKSIIMPIKDSKGKITEFISIGENITNIKEIEEKNIKESNFRKSILHNQPNIILLIDTKKGIIFANNKLFDKISFNNLSTLKKYHDCICEIFVEREGFLKKTTKDRHWTKDFEDFPNKLHKAIILDKNNNENVFKVTLNKLPKNPSLYLVNLSDISEYEKCKQIRNNDKIMIKTILDLFEDIEIHDESVLKTIEKTLKTLQ